MQLLLKSAAACEGGSVSMLLGTVGGEVTEKLCLGETLTEALHQLLLTLNSKATSPHLILAPLVAFITPGNTFIRHHTSIRVPPKICHISYAPPTSPYW